MSTLPLAIKRLRSSPGPSAAIAAGLTVAVALAIGVPTYADGAGQRLLVEQLSADETRPPFAFLFRYVGAWNGSLEWEDVQAVNTYVISHAASDLGLPAQPAVRHVRTDKWRLFPGDTTRYGNREPLEWLSLGFVDRLDDHVDVIEGNALPAESGEAVPVLISRALANRLGVQVGESYLLVDSGGESALPIQVAGVWQARDADLNYWLYPPRSFDDVLLTSEPAFRDRVAPVMRREVGLAAWYFVADGSAVTSSRVAGLLDRTAALRATIDGLLPGTTLDLSPEEALKAYSQITARLTLLLYAFGIPIVGLVLYFVTLVAGMAVHRQQGETVVLRSRGATRGQVAGLYVLQWALLGGAALAAGAPLGWLVAALMGRTSSFLSFSPAIDFRPPLDWTSVRFGAGAIALSLAAAIVPVLATAHYTVVTHQQELARALRRPWWQRSFLDVALLIPALYGYALLSRPGSLPLAQLTRGDVFANPLLFLVPALFIFAWALILLRVLPRLMDRLARLSRPARGVVPLLVFHDLAQQSGQVAGPLFLLALTTALATFSASLALTLDRHLHDQIYYRVGADLSVVEQGGFTSESASSNPFAGPGTISASQDGEWVFLPMAEHRALPGVRAAARIGDYPASVSLGGAIESGRFLGLDRLEFPDVAFFRSDFAAEPLGALMNLLAGERRAILVERSFMNRHGLRPGDPLNLTVGILSERLSIAFVVAGAVDRFPTLYAEDGPFFVGNLRYLFERAGGLAPHDVWVSTEPGSSGAIVQALNARGVPVVTATDARAVIAAERARPERQGLFGLLTLGFSAAGLLTVAGIALHALLSFRDRTVELGVLRALGLSLRQMRLYLAGGQAMLMAIGLLAGTMLGLVTGGLFIPFLQADAGRYPNTPPFIVRAAWGEVTLIYALFTLAAAASMGLTLALLRRMRVHEAIKMGETF